jgi:hypothetical protein
MALLQNPIVEEWWDNRMAAMSSEFFQYIESPHSQPVSFTIRKVSSSALRQE